MKLSRPSRFVAALVALFSVLFMQFAMASYVCPPDETGQMNESVAMPAGSGIHDMADCQGMDLEQPGVCHAHDQAGNQSLDKPELPQVRPFFAAGSASTLMPPDAAYRLLAGRLVEVQLARSTAPPLSIQNCCFRI
jgi:hypothetical protein